LMDLYKKAGARGSPRLRRESSILWLLISLWPRRKERRRFVRYGN
jgi:hypothetical protein